MALKKYGERIYSWSCRKRCKLSRLIAFTLTYFFPLFFCIDHHKCPTSTISSSRSESVQETHFWVENFLSGQCSNNHHHLRLYDLPKKLGYYYQQDGVCRSSYDKREGQKAIHGSSTVSGESPSHSYYIDLRDCQYILILYTIIVLT